MPTFVEVSLEACGIITLFFFFLKKKKNLFANTSTDLVCSQMTLISYGNLYILCKFSIFILIKSWPSSLFGWIDLNTENTIYLIYGII